MLNTYSKATREDISVAKKKLIVDDLQNRLIQNNINSTCPSCGGSHIVKNGKKNDIIHFKCKDCNKQFTLFSGTILEKTQYHWDIWVKVVEMVLNHYPIEHMQDVLIRDYGLSELNYKTVFLWKHKIINALAQMPMPKYNISSYKVVKGVFMEKKDYKLFLSLFLWMLIPSIYNVIRMGIISINQVDINILGQMEWFDLIDEILVTTLTVPLFSLLKPNTSSKEKNGLAFVISFGIYTIFALIISTYVSNISEFMNADFASEYLKLQTFSLLIGFISTFCIMLLTLNNDFKMVAILTIVKLVILSILDFVFIDAFLEVGASYSEIITNSLIGFIALIIVYIRKYIGFGKVNLYWLKDYLRIGLFSGLQIFLDNFIYAIMICKMVNAVSESGNYWVANNFIWGWLLIPIMVITEIIKKNNLKKLEFKNTWKYGLIVSVLWLISVPGWSWFIINVMSSDANTILNILYPLVPFYIAYIISSFIDGWFISKGKTIYNTINSFLVNIVYYGIAFILFNKGLFELNIMFVILLFGFGNVFHMLISMLLYKIEIKRKNKEI